MNLRLLSICLTLIAVLNWLPACSLEPQSESSAMKLGLREPHQPSSASLQAKPEPVAPTDAKDFAASPFKLSSRVEQIPLEARLRISVQSPVSAENSQISDSFQAVVLDDFYLSTDNYRKLVIPKNSWIRGKVSSVKKPRLLSRAGKLGIKLDSLVTPQGEYVPLDADLTFMPGVVNEQGLLDPQTDYGDKALEPTQNLLASPKGKIAAIATLGVPVAGTLLAGSVIALFSHGDPATLTTGQELQIMVAQTTDITL